MIVVSNTSPIINMAAVGRLDLLQQLYEKVVIPQAVYNEITVVGAGQPGAMEVQTVDWIEAKEVTNRILVTALQAELDEGEAEAIALAIQLKAHLLLLDERRGRAVASRLGLRFIGLLGVLVEAKQKGYISRVKPLLDDLMAKASFWVSHQLYARVLREVGE
jgi:predicted nucleic acid-binding protein